MSREPINSFHFLFVNKDSRSKSLSNSTDDKAAFGNIKRHVQISRPLADRRKHKKLVSRSTGFVGLQRTCSASTSSPASQQYSNDEEVEDKSEGSFASPARSSGQTPSFNNVRSRRLHAPRLSLRSAIDSVNCLPVALDAGKHKILQYYLREWMPSKDGVPKSCQIIGFTPLEPGDRDLANNIVTNTLLASDSTHLYALLSVAANRMQFITKLQPDRQDAPMLYTVKAIQGIRKCVAEGLPAPERLILDLSYLVLGEMYAPNPNHSEVYWQIMRQLVINCGGFWKLEPYTSYSALGVDYMLHASTVSPPAFDFMKYPCLLGLEISNGTDEKEVERLILSAVTQLNPRVRATCEGVIHLNRMMQKIHKLPQAIVKEVARYVGRLLRPFVRYNVAPLQPRNAESSNYQQQPTTADLHYRRARLIGCMVWLWHVTLSFIDEPLPTSAFNRSPTLIADLINDAARSILCAEAMLVGTAWYIPDDFMLWTLSTLALVTTTSRDIFHFARHAAMVAERMNVQNGRDLETKLAGHLPLDRIKENAYESLTELLILARSG